MPFGGMMARGLVLGLCLCLLGARGAAAAGSGSVVEQVKELKSLMDEVRRPLLRCAAPPPIINTQAAARRV